MSELIIGFVFGMAAMLGFVGWFYIPKVIELRNELARIKSDLMRK